ncbi:MAG: 50S ribosomal protein L11, partial [Alphaproteobacteria bacterium]
VSFFLKKAAKLKKGASNPSREVAGSVTEAQVREIATEKMEDMNARDVEAAMESIKGSARSMGLEVKG